MFYKYYLHVTTDEKFWSTDKMPPSTISTKTDNNRQHRRTTGQLLFTVNRQTNSQAYNWLSLQDVQIRARHNLYRKNKTARAG